MLDALDLWLAPYVLAAEAEAVPRLAGWVTQALVQAAPQPLTWLDHAVSAFDKQLDLEQRLPAEAAAGAASDGRDDSAGKLALARSLGADDAGQGMARILAATLEAQQRRRFSPVHIAARLAQVDAIAARADAARAQVQAAHDALAARLAPRLWLPPALAEDWLAAHRQTLATLAGLRARLAATRAGFAAHPVAAALPAVAPAPVALDAA